MAFMNFARNPPAPLHDESTADAMDRDGDQFVTPKPPFGLRDQYESDRDSMDREAFDNVMARINARLDEKEKPRDKSEIDVALDTLNTRAGELHDMITRIVERLDPVLAQAVALNEDVKPVVTDSRLGQLLFERCDDVQSATRRLQSILERLAI